MLLFIRDHMNCLFIRVTQLFVLNISIHMFVVFGFVFFNVTTSHLLYSQSRMPFSMEDGICETLLVKSAHLTQVSCAVDMVNISDWDVFFCHKRCQHFQMSCCFFCLCVIF